MARAKKTASVTSTAPKTRGIDLQEVEARVTALDKAKRRSYDIFDIEQRVYDLEKNSGGGGGGAATQFFTRVHTDAVTGNVTISKTGKYILWTDLISAHLSTYGFTLNGESANTLISAGLKSTQDPVGQGFGYAYYEFELTSGDVFAWSCSYDTRCFVMFSE